MLFIFEGGTELNVFEAVKQSVTARQAAERYGIRVNRNGMARCPFHDDKNPSMKADSRFHCFGCQADGDVIDFVSRLQGVGAKEAALMLAQDFSISFDEESHARRRIRPRLKKLSEEQKCVKALSDYLHLLHRWRERYAPRQPDEEWHPLFVEALRSESHVEHLLDVLLSGDIRERTEIVNKYGEKIGNLERRMKSLAAGDAVECETDSRNGRTAPEI